MFLVLRRLAQAFLILLGVAAITFVLLYALPADPARMSAVDAYLLCSVCGDLRISEIVDMPNWVVSFYFPRIVFA